MNEIVGIDLGTTNSLIGVMDAGFPILIADKNGARLTPSVVHFPADGLPLVGESDRGPSVDAGSRGVQSATARDVATICGQRVERKQRLEPCDATAGDQHA